jgi:hypothetical protein
LSATEALGLLLWKNAPPGPFEGFSERWSADFAAAREDWYAATEAGSLAAKIALRPGPVKAALATAARCA